MYKRFFFLAVLAALGPALAQAEPTMPAHIPNDGASIFCEHTALRELEVLAPEEMRATHGAQLPQIHALGAVGGAALGALDYAISNAHTQAWSKADLVDSMVMGAVSGAAAPARTAAGIVWRVNAAIAHGSVYGAASVMENRQSVPVGEKGK